MKTIAHILPYPGVGGTELATLRIAQATQGRYRHVMFCRRDARGVAELFRDQGFDTALYSAVEPSYHRPWAFLRETRELAHAMKARGADLMHCSDYLGAHYTAAAGWWADLPILCHVRVRMSAISARDKTFVLPVDRYIFVSKATWLQFGIRVPEQRGVVVYDGLEIPAAAAPEATWRLRTEWGFGPGTKVIGMVARVAPPKDYLTLIKAAAIVTKKWPDTRFVMVGDYAGNPEHYARVRKWLRQYEMVEHFLFLGFHAAPAQMLPAMDICVLSTHHEGLPLVILEAMAQARPVAATNVDGVPEVVVDGETGLLHRDEDAEGLAANLVRLLENPAVAAKLGEAGRERLRERFSREAFRASMYAVYDEMLSEPAAPGAVRTAGSAGG